MEMEYSILPLKYPINLSYLSRLNTVRIFAPSFCEFEFDISNFSAPESSKS